MTHEELALRIEALDGPDRAIDVEVAKLFGKPCGPYEDVCIETRSTWYINETASPYTASLDAAASLMAEGWKTVIVEWDDCIAGFDICLANDDHQAYARAKTEPLARLAAAVRAHGKGAV